MDSGDSDVSTLAAAPLWPGTPPEWVAENWTKMRAALLSAPDEHWKVWTDWYEARLRGDSSNDPLEQARASIPYKMWDQGPKAVNAEILRLIKAHAPTRKQLAKTSSPDPAIKNGKLDVQDSPYDVPKDGADLIQLPAVQRSIIKTLIEALGQANNIPSFVSTALVEYSDELLVRGTRPYLGILIHQYGIVSAEYRNLQREGFITNDGLKRSFRSFFETHKKIIGNFPLNTKREQMLLDTPVDRAAWDVDEVRSLADAFIQSVKGAEAEGIATPDFVKVSVSIADDLKTATYSPPSAPIDAMDANRDLMAAPELSTADRAVIRAMTFTDSVRALVNDGSHLSPEVQKKAEDSGLTVALNLISNAIWKALGG